MARERPDATPLLAARVHRFFRGIPGIWACCDTNCSELPDAFRGKGLTGKLYVQPRRECDCGCRAFELVACRNCGTAMFHAYARSARQPDYLWTENVGDMDEVDDAVVPIHLCLEDPEDHDSEDCGPTPAPPSDFVQCTCRWKHQLAIAKRACLIPAQNAATAFRVSLIWPPKVMSHFNIWFQRN